MGICCFPGIVLSLPLGVHGPLGQVDTWDCVIHPPPLVLVCAMEGMGLNSDIMGHPTIKSWSWAPRESELVALRAWARRGHGSPGLCAM